MIFRLRIAIKYYDYMKPVSKFIGKTLPVKTYGKEVICIILNN